MIELMEIVTESRAADERRSGTVEKKRTTPIGPSGGGELAKTGFDYSQLRDDIAETAKEAVRVFHETQRNVVAAIHETREVVFAEIHKAGRLLLAAKKALPHGYWIPWVKAEFGHSHKTATTWMNVAKAYAGADEMEATNLSLTGLGVLATSKHRVRRQRVIADVQTGKVKNTVAAVKKAIAPNPSTAPCALAQEAAAIHQKNFKGEMDLLTRCVRSLAQRGAKNASNVASVSKSPLPDSWIETTVRSAIRALYRVTGTDAETESGEAPRLEGRCKELWHLLQQLLEADAGHSAKSASPVLDRLRECGPALKKLTA